MAGTTGLEPATSDVTGRRSNQLNYVPEMENVGNFRLPRPHPALNSGSRVFTRPPAGILVW
jgi:hypothetical protein